MRALREEFNRVYQKSVASEEELEDAREEIKDLKYRYVLMLMKLGPSYGYMDIHVESLRS